MNPKSDQKRKRLKTKITYICLKKPEILDKKAKNNNINNKISIKQEIETKNDSSDHLCEKTSENKSKYDRHMFEIHNLIESNEELIPFPELVETKNSCEGRIKCGKCRFQTNSEAQMILHSLNHSVNNTIDSSLKLKCPTCNQWFTKALLLRHVYIHTSEKAFKCEFCQKDFSRRQSMESHQRRHFPQNVFKCELCDNSSVTERGLKSHMKTHEKDREKKYWCEVCGTAFFDKESLKSHTIRIHLPKTARRFKCEFKGCRYTTLYNHQLLEHQRIHSDEKPFACDQCKYTAKSKWSFRKHYRQHTNEKPFKCKVCEYSSSLCSNLKRHMRIHTGSKPFKCPYCSYSCNNHENLRKHVLKSKKHEGLHLYNCKHCLFSTNSFSELRQHLEIKHNDIYSVEEIDSMISSFYHKNEDKTTFESMEVNQINKQLIPNETQNSNDIKD